MLGNYFGFFHGGLTDLWISLRAAGSRQPAAGSWELGAWSLERKRRRIKDPSGCPTTGREAYARTRLFDVRALIVTLCSKLDCYQNTGEVSQGPLGGFGGR
jgi:hypothetical protein